MIRDAIDREVEAVDSGKSFFFCAFTSYKTYLVALLIASYLGLPFRMLQSSSSNSTEKLNSWISS